MTRNGESDMTYRVIDVETGETHGDFDTLDEAKGCVEFDRLTDWEIWDNADTCILYGVPGRTAQ